jgi:hypothetical protein
MKTVVLQRSDRDIGDAQNRFMPSPDDDYLRYPGWARLRLDSDDLKRLGINDLPKAGARYQLAGEFHVKRSEDATDKADRNVSGVIHRFGFEPIAGADEPREKSIREELESARHQASGTTASSGRIGARFLNNGNGNGRS